MPTWNAQQYLKFEAERTQPAIDLARRIDHAAPETILDVGCGPGNSTQVLREQFPQADILGVDSAPSMLAAAQKAYPALRFAQCDATGGLPALGAQHGPFDVVFSNACLQWVPNHPALLRDMMQLLRPDGVLAVQIPMNQQEPVHTILTQLAESRAWREKLSQPRSFHTLPQDAYYDILSALSQRVQLWETAYLHCMPSHEAILEWYRGTGMRPYLDALTEAEQPLFEQAVLAELRRAYPPRKNGTVLFRFPRFFFTAVR